METNLTPANSELNVKLERIQKLLAQSNLDALLLRQTGNFSWLTCGADSHINTADILGLASLLITPTGRHVITNNIESPRLIKERAAAYAARAGLMCVVIIPSGTRSVALGKLSQAIIHHARVLPIEGNFDVALNLVRELSEQGSITLVNSVNPYRIEGQKTGAFEIVDELGDAPDILALPVGNAGNITAYWRGFNEYHKIGKTSRLPKMFGFQAAGAAPIVNGAPAESPQTIATAIRIGNPVSYERAIRTLKWTDGIMTSVTDGKHRDGSMHYGGLATDLRSRHLERDILEM